MENLLSDVRYSLKGLLKRPGFSAVVVITLALGIGSSTTVFTVINAVLLKSLPVKHPEQLVLFSDSLSEGTFTGDPRVGRWDEFSFPAYEYLRDHDQSFENLCAFRSGTARLSVIKAREEPVGGLAVAHSAEGHLVSGNYFPVFDVQPFKGRLLGPDDDAESSSPATVISYRYWRDQFNSDESIVGKRLIINNSPFTVVGVTQPEFFGERVRRPPDLWLPLSFQPQIEMRESYLKDARAYWLTLLGRLRPQVNIDQAQAQTNFELRQFLAAQVGSDLTVERRADIEKTYVQLRDGSHGISFLRVNYAVSLQMLMAIVSAVLLIVCANIGNLFLSRARARRTELSLRIALGASRSRIIRQLLSESLLLSLAGGVAGIILAQWGVKLLVAMVTTQTPLDTRVDLRVLLFTAAVSMFAALLLGLAPAIWVMKLDLNSALKERSRLGHEPRRFGLTSGLVTTQVALSMVLLTGASLFARTLVTLQNEDLGFNRDDVLLVKVDPRLAGYKVEELPTLYQRLQERLKAIPTVRSVTMATYSPISGYRSKRNITVQHYNAAPEGAVVETMLVGPNYLETMGVPLLQGREIGPVDKDSSSPIAVVNKAFAERYLREQNPVGATFYFGDPGDKDPHRIQIVGVIGNIKMSDPRQEPTPAVFDPILQARNQSAYSVTFHVRTLVEATSLTPAIRDAIREIDSKLPTYDVTTLRNQIEANLRQDRLVARLMAFFSFTALVIAAIGLYGVLSHGVVRRTNEIGIRMALGAEPARIAHMIMRETLALVLIGLAVGVPMSLAAAQLISKQLYGLKPTDPLSFSVAIIVLLVVAAMAGYVPARRASRVDPLIALRYE